MNEIQTVEQKRPALVAGASVRAIVPATIEETFRMARAIAAAGWAPKSYLVDQKRAEQGYDESRIVVGIMHGLELGLTPIAALQSIAVINGTPSIWGDGALAVVQASGLMEDFSESPLINEKGQITGYVCTAKRRGVPTPISHKFTLDDAKAAGLLDKLGPWQQYRSRMMQMRARAWTLRAGFADVLRGLSIAEEAQDIVVEAPAKRQEQPRRSQAALDAFATRPTAQVVEPPEVGNSIEELNGHHEAAAEGAG